MAFALSPMVTILIWDAFGSEAISALIFLATPEWTAPHKPRSDVSAMSSVPGLGASSFGVHSVDS